MAYRLIQTQSLHDRVIQIAAQNLQGTGNYRVYTNPNQQHNMRIGDFFPDIIVTPYNSNNVQFIIEVETSDSVNANEAINQWKSYSTLGGTFYLLVPSTSRIIAGNLCTMYGIKAKFGTFSSNYGGDIIINYE